MHPGTVLTTEQVQAQAVAYVHVIDPPSYKELEWPNSNFFGRLRAYSAKTFYWFHPKATELFLCRASVEVTNLAHVRIANYRTASKNAEGIYFRLALENAIKHYDAHLLKSARSYEQDRLDYEAASTEMSDLFQGVTYDVVTTDDV